MTVVEQTASGVEVSIARTAHPLPVYSSLQDARISWPLKWFAVLLGLCTCAGVLLYCYDDTLASIRRELVWVHQYSGDAAILVFVVYLVQHVRRVWGLRRVRAISWWTGLAGVLVWLLVSVTGAWGQLDVLDRFTEVWWLHAIASVAVLVVLGFHAAFGFRARLELRKDNE